MMLTYRKPLSQIAAAFLTLALTACATPRERVRTVYVQTPVAVRCVELSVLRPMPPKPVASLPTDERRALSVALDWLADLVPWAVEADGQLRACAGD
jgi:hypothetical protein